MVICVYYTKVIPWIIFGFTYQMWINYLLIAKHSCDCIYNLIQVSKLLGEKDIFISN